MQGEELTGTPPEESAAELFDEPVPSGREDSETTDSADDDAEENATADKPKRKSRKKSKDEGEIPDEPPEETEEEKQRRQCRELNDLCAVMSHRIDGYLHGDIEFESLVSALQAATEEYVSVPEEVTTCVVKVELFPPPCSACSTRQVSSTRASSGVNFLSSLSI